MLVALALAAPIRAVANEPTTAPTPAGADGPATAAPTARDDEPASPVEPTLATRWAEFDRLHRESAEGERRLMWGLTGAAIASTAAGAALLSMDGHDDALRVAGGVTVGFAVIDAALGAMALAGQRQQRHAWARRYAERGDRRALVAEQDRFAREQGQEAWVFALNLGLDVGYVMAGAAGATASFFGVDHPDRWLAGGLAALAQGAILVVIDSVGVVRARRYQSAAMDAMTSLALSPVVSTIDGGRGAMLGLAGRF